MASYGRVTIGERFLEDRAYLLITYPEKKEDQVVYSGKKAKIPFYETPMITESQTPRYAKYQLLGRNSNLMSFLGADSRTFNLSFTLTLPHLQFFLKESPWESLSEKVESAKFDIKSETQNTPAVITDPRIPGVKIKVNNVNDGALLDSLAEERGFKDFQAQDGFKSTDTIRYHEDDFLNLRAQELGVGAEALRANQESEGGFIAEGLAALLPEPEPEKTVMDIKAAFYYYINLLRSTTIGSARMGLGPPIVRLNFGPLYQDVPCITTKYDLSVEGPAGYDKKTLLPNRVKFTLNLMEVRVGNFGSHLDIYADSPDPFDDVPTWESVLKHGTVDPRLGPRLV